MIDLYHWEPNGSHLKPLILLHEKGLPFRSHYVDVLSFQQYEYPAFNATTRETHLNLEGEGPVLIHDGKQVSESLFMLEYLEDAFPQKSFRPDEPLGHARVLAWARFINEVFMPGASTLGCHAYLAPEFKGRDATAFEAARVGMTMNYLQDGWRLAVTDGYSSEVLEDSKRKVSIAVKRFEEALGASQWLVGPEYSLADIDAFAICNSLPTLTPDLVNVRVTPRLMDWMNRIRSRPAVRAALASSRTGQPEQAFAPGPEHSRWG